MSPVPRPRPIVATRALCLVLLCVLGCREQPPTGDGPLVVYAAASLTRPLRAALDSFAARTGTTYELETAASLELVRRVTDLGQTPDALVLADYQLFPKTLAEHVDGYTIFARNRIVLAYTPRSRWAREISGENWREVVTRPGGEVGRADPNTDPSGYRTLLTFQLAEMHYREPGLARRLLDAAPPRNVRPREADQIALIEAGALDYVWTYENLALGAGLPYVRLPDAVDLGSLADSATYGRASVRVRGGAASDSITLRGEPIAYGAAVPRNAQHPTLAARFVEYLVSADGRRVLRQERLDAMENPIVVPGR